MTTAHEPTAPLQVCTDCLMLIANGDVPPDWEAEQVETWLAAISDGQDRAGIVHYAVGRSHEDCDHDELYDQLLACETEPFSSRPCDVCGSRLAGVRHAVTGWIDSEVQR